MPEQWSKLLTKSAITKEDYAKDPQAVLEVLEFYTDHQKREIEDLTIGEFCNNCHLSRSQQILQARQLALTQELVSGVLLPKLRTEGHQCLDKKPLLPCWVVIVITFLVPLPVQLSSSRNRMSLVPFQQSNHHRNIFLNLHEMRRLAPPFLLLGLPPLPRDPLESPRRTRGLLSGLNPWLLLVSFLNEVTHSNRLDKNVRSRLVSMTNDWNNNALKSNGKNSRKKINGRFNNYSCSSKNSKGG